MDWGRSAMIAKYLFFTQGQRQTLLAIRRSWWQLEQKCQPPPAGPNAQKLSVLILALVNTVSLHEIAKKP
jgi:hypothetical protein